MEFEEIVERVQDSKDPPELWRLLLTLCEQAGVVMVSYHHYGVNEDFGTRADQADEDTYLVSPTETLHIVTHGFPKEWVDHYVRDRLYLIDPIPELAQRVTDPFFWSDTAAIAKVVGMQSSYLDELLEAGIGEGLAVQVFGPAMRDGYFGLGFGDTRPDVTAEQIRKAQAVLQLIHIRYCSMVLEVMAARVSLSPREREVLEWIAKGKSNSVIAEILGLSHHTIDTMVRRIFQKLGVNDRTTAAIKGVGAGLVMPDANLVA